MHRLFESHIRAVLERHRPKTMLEIGVYKGDHTLKLLEWCAAAGSRLTSLDPVQWEGDLPDEVKAPQQGYQYKRGKREFEHVVIRPLAIEEVHRRGLDRHWTCVKTRSLDFMARPDFRGFDVYLIDGDHNYYTVTRELDAIHRVGWPGTLAFFHDTSGTWARRDLCYDPEFIPDEGRDPSRQGVLTAIEDFLQATGSRRRLWRDEGPYRFRILTRRYEGLGLLQRLAQIDARAL